MYRYLVSKVLNVSFVLYIKGFYCDMKYNFVVYVTSLQFGIK